MQAFSIFAILAQFYAEVISVLHLLTSFYFGATMLRLWTSSLRLSGSTMLHLLDSFLIGSPATIYLLLWAFWFNLLIKKLFHWSIFAWYGASEFSYV